MIPHVHVHVKSSLQKVCCWWFLGGKSVLASFLHLFWWFLVVLWWWFWWKFSNPPKHPKIRGGSHQKLLKIELQVEGICGHDSSEPHFSHLFLLVHTTTRGAKKSGWYIVLLLTSMYKYVLRAGLVPDDSVLFLLFLRARPPRFKFNCYWYMYGFFNGYVWRFTILLWNK